MERVSIPGVTLLEEVGRGRGGVVFRARSSSGACIVKLPSDHPPPRGDDALFEQDTLALGRFSAVGLPRLLQIGSDGDTPYAVLEESHGEPLPRRLQRPLSDEACLSICQALCRALRALHGAGFSCGGLIAERVIVVEGGGEPCLGLLDRGSIVRTSPMQASTDLRALGELFAACARALIDDAAATPRRALRSELRRIASQLVAGRLTDLAALGAVLDELATCGEVSPSRHPPPLEFASAARAPGGERTELAQLRSFWELTREQGGRVVEVLGAPGSGKTHLLSAFVRELAERDVLVLSAKCHDRDWAPFSALKRLLEGHVAGLVKLTEGRREEVEQALRVAAGPMGPLIRGLSPALTHVFGGAAATIAAGDARQVFVGGMADFLARYIESAGRSVLVIDDLHWLDASSRDVLSLVASRICPKGHLVVCGARDDAESGESVERFRRRLPPDLTDRIALRPMDERAAASLTADFLGLDAAPSRELVRHVLQISDGSPLSLLELLRLCVERGHLRPIWGNWQLDLAAVQRMQLPASSQAVIERRLEPLDATTLAVLRAAAVAGPRIRAELLARATALPVPQVAAALERATTARLVEIAGDGTLRFLHDCVWEALLRGLPEQARRELHERIAHALTCEGGDGAEYECEVARHLAAGVRSDPALVYEATRRAASHAVAACDDALALSFLHPAQRVASQAAIELDRAFYVELAEASLRVGNSGEALTHFQRALEHSAAAFERAHVLGRIAWIHHFESNAGAAWQALESALSELHRAPPADTPGRFAATVARWGLRRTLRPRTAAARLDRSELEVLCALYIEDVRISLEHGRPLRGISAVLELSLIAAWLPPCRIVVHAELLMAFVLSTLGADRRWRAALARAQGMAQALGDPIAQMLCHQVSFVIFGWEGDLDVAERHARLCVDERAHLMELGELCHVCLGMCGIETVRGRPLAALAWTERAIERVRQQGRAPAVFSLIEEAARSTLLALGREREIARLDRRLQYVARAEIKPGGYFHQLSYQSRVQRLTELGDLGPEFEATVDEFDALGLNPKQVHLAVVIYYLHVADARVHQCLQASPEARRELLPKLERAASDIEQAARVPALVAHAKLARAATRWFAGHAAKAERLIAEASRLAVEQGCASVSYGVARLRAHMLRAQGRESAARDEAKIAAMFAREYGHVHRLRWIQREFALDDVAPRAQSEGEAPRVRRHLDALLHISQASSRELSPERQARLVLDELLETLGAERAFLFVRSHTGEGLDLRAARRAGGADLEPEARFDQALLDRVYATGQVALRDAEGSGEPDARSYRACLVAPLVLREQPIGVVYLDRADSAGSFGAGDAELLVALANQVPVALELAGALRERERLEQNLRQAQKMEAIGRFAGGIAHDFNNLLSTIQMAADSLHGKLGLQPGTDQEVDDIEDAARRGAELTRQLLTFSRGEAILPRRMSLGEVVGGLTQMLDRLTGPGIEILVRIDDATPILADPGQIERVLMNLCANATDAISGRGTIGIEVDRIDGANTSAAAPDLAMDREYARLTVRDTGTGMSEEVRARLFEPFFTTKSRQRGTGLGLANVYAIVQQCHGHIDLATELGRGSTFHIYFPIAEVEPAGVEAANYLVDPSLEDEDEQVDGISVLVVDDDAQVRRDVARLLEREGYRVLLAADGQQALELYDTYDGLVELAVSDVRMPRMDGPALAKCLLERDPEIKLLFISGDPSEALVRAQLGRRASFLAKPFNAQALLQHVRRCLGAPSPAAPVALAEE